MFECSSLGQLHMHVLGSQCLLRSFWQPEMSAPACELVAWVSCLHSLLMHCHPLLDHYSHMQKAHHMVRCLISLACCALPSCRYDCIWIQWCLLYLTDGELSTGDLQDHAHMYCMQQRSRAQGSRGQFP